MDFRTSFMFLRKEKCIFRRDFENFEYNFSQRHCFGIRSGILSLPEEYTFAAIIKIRVLSDYTQKHITNRHSYIFVAIVDSQLKELLSSNYTSL